MRKLLAGVLVLGMTVVAGIAMSQQETQDNPNPSYSIDSSTSATGVHNITNSGAASPSTFLSSDESLAGTINSDQAPYILLAADKMQQCLTCCATKLNACGNAGSCNTLYQNCVAYCNSHGETPSDWRCW